MALTLVKTAPPEERRLGSCRDPNLNLWSRFTGHYKGFRDNHAGVYWETLAPIEGHALTIQKLFIKAGRRWI